MVVDLLVGDSVVNSVEKTAGDETEVDWVVVFLVLVFLVVFLVMKVE